MKKITLLLFLITSFFGVSQNTVTVDVADTWLGYMVVFDNPTGPTQQCGGGYCFDQPWGIGALVITLGSTDITLTPNVNTYADNAGSANPNDVQYWTNSTDGGTTAGLDGNKIMQAISYVEPVGLNGADLTFTGNITTNDLDPRYNVIAFIKTIGGTGINNTVDIKGTTGVFSVSATAAELASGTVQFGFEVTGLNANPVDNWGSVVVAPVALGVNDYKINDFNVSPNPSNNVWNIKGQQTIENIQVFDVLGKQVMTVKPNNTDVELNANTLPKGLYFAKMNTEYGSNTIKLIKN